MGNAAKKQEIAEVKTSLPTMTSTPGETIDASDILLPSIYLMQSNSQWVKDEKAKVGEIVKSTGTQVVAKKKESLVLIPLAFNKSFRIVEKKGNKWVRNEPFNPAKSDEWEFSEGGKDLKRVTSINLYAFLLSELETQEKAQREATKTGEMMDPTQIALPVMISFRSTGYKAGKEAVTHFALAQKVKAEPYMGKLMLSAHETTNDQGTFYVYDLKPFRDGKKLSRDQYESCKEWRTLMLAGQVKVDESGERSDESTADEENAQY